MTDPRRNKPEQSLSGFALAGNYIPLVLCGTGIGLVLAVPGLGWKIAIALFWIYGLPPLLARIVFQLWGRPQGRGLSQETTAFKVWWFTHQLQVPHNRFPWIDETLRLVPGLYSLWLTSWGSKASPFVYWAPGARVIDRSLVDISKGAVIGMESALAGHAGQVFPEEGYRVDIGTVTVEAGAILGARSGLGPGAVLAAGEMLPAGRGIAPFTRWQGQKRYRIEEDTMTGQDLTSQPIADNNAAGKPSAPRPSKRDIPVPGTLNIAILAGSLFLAFICLYTAAHTGSWWIVAAAAVIFSFVNNTIFALHHEAVHGHFHPNRTVNEVAGNICAAMFPTSFTIQRISHLGHHRRNRTDEELYDYYLPNQSRWLKTYWIYCLLFGFYWSIIPVACCIYFIAPWVFATKAFKQGPARLWGFERFIEDIAAEPKGQIWRQTAFMVCWQVAIFWLLGLNIVSWLVCYWAFGINWSSLQYADHAWSDRNVREGAWNLKVTPIIRKIFLNYHYHKVHHRWPIIPWIHLPRYVHDEQEQPSFWKIYLSLWGGARPAPEGKGPRPLGKDELLAGMDNP